MRQRAASQARHRLGDVRSVPLEYYVALPGARHNHSYARQSQAPEHLFCRGSASMHREAADPVLAPQHLLVLVQVRQRNSPLLPASALWRLQSVRCSACACCEAVALSASNPLTCARVRRSRPHLVCSTGGQHPGPASAHAAGR